MESTPRSQARRQEARSAIKWRRRLSLEDGSHVAHLESHRGGPPSIIPTCNEAACCSRADNNAHNSLSTLARNLSPCFPWNRRCSRAPTRSADKPPLCLDFNQISRYQKLSLKHRGWWNYSIPVGWVFRRREIMEQSDLLWRLSEPWAKMSGVFFDNLGTHMWYALIWSLPKLVFWRLSKTVGLCSWLSHWLGVKHMLIQLVR